jgi:curved DNA-binding protein CbpA
MSPDEQKRLGAFLKAHSQHSVKAYLGLQTEFDEIASEAALEKRRVWAQAQQTNPKFQDEAIWILSNLSVLRRALTVPPEELLWLDRGEDKPVQSPDSMPFYEILGLPRNATSAQINDAHRLRYRDARHLKNRHEAHQIYAALDEAWRVLGNPDLKKAYDAELAPEIRLQDSEPLSDHQPPTDLLAEKKALTDAPPLSIRGERQIELAVTNKVVRRKIRIERDGAGLVDATIRSDQAWLLANPVTLDPHAAAQDIHVDINPAKMAGKSALGQIVIQNFNGQRLSVHVKVTKVLVNRARIATALFLFMATVGALLIYPPTRSVLFKPASVVAPNPVLILKVNPGPAKVTINDQSFDAASTFRFDDLSPGRPLMLLVEKEGFERHFQRIALKSGEELRMEVSLKQSVPQTDR